MKESHAVRPPELDVAVDWWARAITGEPDHPEQIATFKSVLRRCIELDEHWWRSWKNAIDTGNPRFAEVWRIIATDYGPEGHLHEALKIAGISRLRVPVRTVMWVNPGEVLVTRGHGASIETIYGGNRSSP